MRGASELWLLGASEMLFAGASERAFLGGSEYRFRGASERQLRGRQRAAPRRRHRADVRGRERTACTRGASERRAGRRSERFGGASERLVGASDASRSGRVDADGNSPLPTPRPPTDRRESRQPPWRLDISRWSCTPTCRSSVTRKIRR